MSEKSFLQVHMPNLFQKQEDLLKKIIRALKFKIDRLEKKKNKTADEARILERSKVRLSEKENRLKKLWYIFLQKVDEDHDHEIEAEKEKESRDREWGYRQLIKRKILVQPADVNSAVVRRKLVKYKEDGINKTESEVRQEFYDKQIQSLEPWLNYIESETFEPQVKFFLVSKILELQNGPNGNWKKRGQGSTEEFPLFMAGEVHRVIPPLTELLYESTVEGFTGEIWSDELSESELGPIKFKKLMDTVKSGDFAKLYKLIAEFTAPKNYENYEGLKNWKTYSIKGLNEQDKKIRFKN